jgi:hypothetical protein
VICTAEEFARLRRSDDPDEYQRASSEEAPLEVWLSIVERMPELREWVAHNKTVPLSILEQLANDPDSGVRATVAGKRKLSPALQWALARDPDPSVRERLAYNGKCLTEVLCLLSEDMETFVKMAAVKRLAGRRSAL